MRIPRSKGLRPLSFFVLGVGLACGAQAQAPRANDLVSHAMDDITLASPFVGGRPQAASSGPLPPAAFAPLVSGGPWAPPPASGLAPSAQTAFAQALQGRWAEVKAAVTEGAVPVDARDEQGRTLLTLAAAAGDLQAVRDLLAQGAGPERSGWLGLTPLAAAARQGHELVVRELLMAGADVNRPAQGLNTPLHLAAQMGQLRVMRQLLRAGADTGVHNRAGLTPLGEAARLGQVPAMAALVAAGVSPDQPDLHRLNALHTAALAEQPEAMAWLQSRGVPVPSPLTQVLMDTVGQRPVPPR
jgi:hypothetical protein